MSDDKDEMLEKRLEKDSKDDRHPYFRDQCRVIHSFGFRRLQGKAQILGPSQGDFHRTRMTHSLEVSSIANGIARQLWEADPREVKENGVEQEDIKKLFCNDFADYIPLITTISLLHDIGHPPFGHAGEYALNYMMRNHGGFEGSAQTLRLLTKVESFKKDGGLNLTRRTLLGVLKYPAKY